ncbi:MAG: hypothetical protein O7E52_10020 [Candidatus Poribacteria bacterium]|nr:hypothetical protein [Candidatus Poribacteria bacterium]
MNEERREILRMLAEGKISVEEADMLLEAIEDGTERQAEAADGHEERRKCYGPFFEDFDFGNFGETFANFEGIFSNFGDMFVGAAKRKNAHNTRQ